MSKVSSGAWQRARLKEVLEQIEHNQERLLNKNNRYGYEININHPLIYPKWINFKEKWNKGEIETSKPLYDDTARRLTFESLMKQSKYFQTILKKEIKQQRKVEEWNN